MSSIPSSKMKHAHAHEGDHPEGAQHPSSHQAEAQGGAAEPQAAQTDATAGGKTEVDAPAQQQPVQAAVGKGSGVGLSGRAQRLAGWAEELAEEAVGAVKARPRTAAAIGAAIIAGTAAIVAGPAAARALKGDNDDKPAPKRKAAKKPASKSGTKKA